MPSPLWLLPLLRAALAARVVLDHGDSAAALAGTVLRGRYVLQERLHSAADRPARADPWSNATPDGAARGARFAGPELLGLGGFGEVWKAQDRQSGAAVAVKLFVKRAEWGVGPVSYFTGADRWSSGVAENAGAECRLVQGMLAKEGAFPAGRRHICRCLEEHVADRAPGELLFLVLEYCGKRSLQEELELRGSEPGFLADARRWMKDVLEAVRFMSGLTPPVRHGDLALRNVMASADGGVRLVDFGMASSEPDGGWRNADLEFWAKDYASLLCGGDRKVGKGGRSCADGTPGIGDAADWEAMAEAKRTMSAERTLNVMP